MNNTGICLGCQRGFTHEPQEDAWKAPVPTVNGEEFEEKSPDAYLKENPNPDAYLKEEIDHADEEPSPKKVDAQEQTSDGEEVGKRIPKRKKATKKGKKRKVTKRKVNNNG